MPSKGIVLYPWLEPLSSTVFANLLVSVFIMDEKWEFEKWWRDVRNTLQPFYECRFCIVCPTERLECLTHTTTSRSQQRWAELMYQKCLIVKSPDISMSLNGLYVWPGLFIGTLWRSSEESIVLEAGGGKVGIVFLYDLQWQKQALVHWMFELFSYNSLHYEYCMLYSKWTTKEKQVK